MNQPKDPTLVGGKVIPIDKKKPAIIEFKDGQVIDPADHGNCGFIVVSGRVKICREIQTLLGAQTVVVDIAIKGNPFNETSTFCIEEKPHLEDMNIYVAEGAVSVLPITLETLEDRAQRVGKSFMAVLISYLSAQALTKNRIRKRSADLHAEVHNLNIQNEQVRADRRSPPPNAPSEEIDVRDRRIAELEKDLESGRETQKELRGVIVALTNALLESDEKKARLYVEAARFLRECAKSEGINLPDKKLEEWFAPGKRDLNEALKKASEQVLSAFVDAQFVEVTPLDELLADQETINVGDEDLEPEAPATMRASAPPVSPPETEREGSGRPQPPPLPPAPPVRPVSPTLRAPVAPPRPRGSLLGPPVTRRGAPPVSMQPPTVAAVPAPRNAMPPPPSSPAQMTESGRRLQPFKLNPTPSGGIAAVNPAKPPSDPVPPSSDAPEIETTALPESYRPRVTSIGMEPFKPPTDE